MRQKEFIDKISSKIAFDSSYENYKYTIKQLISNNDIIGLNNELLYYPNIVLSMVDTSSHKDKNYSSKLWYICDIFISYQWSKFIKII